MAAYEEIIYETKDAVGILTLNNPGKANALSTRMMPRITDLLTGRWPKTNRSRW